MGGDESEEADKTADTSDDESEEAEKTWNTCGDVEKTVVF